MSRRKQLRSQQVQSQWTLVRWKRAPRSSKVSVTIVAGKAIRRPTVGGPEEERTEVPRDSPGKDGRAKEAKERKEKVKAKAKEIKAKAKGEKEKAKEEDKKGKGK